MDKYEPDLLWFDFGFCHPEFEKDRKRIAAYYYNKGIEWEKGVVLNYKRWTKPSKGVTEVAFPAGAGTLDLEREKSPRIRKFFWQTDTSIVLYAIVLGWPDDGNCIIKSLGSQEKQLSKITSVNLLGFKGKINWSREKDGLKVKMPDRKPCEHAFVLAIRAEEPL